ncbi:hypothetical protein CCACVL1_02717 [Corchorus capsularis]|uniref:Uncharacterized protein n=1 Tax=Corchorus capsularis TaxID=210143 RepID=A0A1R3K6K7_COCAP|nr:hypothetical protein CCACVL1_02717 [Corchorus capsularis]
MASLSSAPSRSNNEVNFIDNGELGLTGIQLEGDCLIVMNKLTENAEQHSTSFGNVLSSSMWIEIEETLIFSMT